MDTLIDVAGLNARMAAGLRTVVLDVRWALGDPEGRGHYLKEHLPGAVYVDLPTQLADPADPAHGRHPLPSQARFQDAARSWGVRDGDVVVAYDDAGNTSAPGCGGCSGMPACEPCTCSTAAWPPGAGRRCQWRVGAVEPDTGDVTFAGGGMRVTDAAGAAGWATGGVLLDARAAERYRGEVEPVDPRAGHIPGAVSAPTTGNLDDDGHFLTAEELRQRFASLGVDATTPTAVYCGSGVTASHEIAALEIAGFSAALYPGSFSQWSNDASRPVATGADPGR